MSDLERAKAEGAKAERERIIAIMSSSEARQNPVLASELAYRQARPAAEAIATLRVFATAGGDPAATSQAAIDASWSAIADGSGAQAGHASPKASSADDSWAESAATVNRESGR